ncbi:Probable RNA-directed DNA polymerase from transposon X-element [Eumeta japonica]|uniref:Probable RNA-directed DNA polymerase from transposon X-element n=1 Tax=Eumeta variegata TaxID=151549 RepID=A0A4C1VT39_EUMVA|nr:Probable RNA-directed DNA polymerase from transposon X-element [Eumeta japonica]
MAVVAVVDLNELAAFAAKVKALHDFYPIETSDITDLEVSVCRLAMTGHLLITIASVYLPPSETLLSGDLEKLRNLDHCLVVLQLGTTYRPQIFKTITDWKQVTERIQSIDSSNLNQIIFDKKSITSGLPTLDPKLNFDKHIKRARDRVVLYFSPLYPMTHARSKLSLCNKVTLFKTCIHPVLTYAGVVFARIPSYKILKLQVIQNRFMLTAASAQWYVRNFNLHKDLDLQTIVALLKEQSKRYFDSAVSYPNPLIAAAAS